LDAWGESIAKPLAIVRIRSITERDGVQLTTGRSRGPDDHDALAAHHIEIEVLQDVKGPKLLVDAGEMDDRIGSGHSGPGLVTRPAT
jgi:hypothetical protein